MYKKLAIALFVASVFAFPALCVESQESVISTEATVNKEVTPDTAILRFYVENSGVNLTAIKEKNDKTVNDAIAAIKANLASNESIKTIAFNIRNVYSYRDKVRVFQKYEVTNGFEVKLKDLDKVSKIINLAMLKGVKNVSNINFIVEDTEKVCNQMMADAVKIGKNRINHIANAASATLSKPKSIQPYCSLSSSHRPAKSRNYTLNAMADSVQAQSGNYETIEAGTINASASVNMVYYLK